MGKWKIFHHLFGLEIVGVSLIPCEKKATLSLPYLPSIALSLAITASLNLIMSVVPLCQ